MQHDATLRPFVAAVMAAALLFSSVPARAQSCDAGTESRLQFLEGRLDEGQRNATWWWRSWLGVFTVGAIYKTAQGATTHDGSNAAAAYIAAGKSVLGIAELTLRPHVARHGAAPMRVISKATPEGCAERLRLAEKTMEMAAGDGNMRWSWKRHLSSLVLNLAAGLAVSEGWHDEGTGWRDFGISEASSELHIWTHPTRAVDDWTEYRSQFDGAPVASGPSMLRFAAIPHGVGVRWEF